MTRMGSSSTGRRLALESRNDANEGNGFWPQVLAFGVVCSVFDVRRSSLCLSTRPNSSVSSAVHSYLPLTRRLVRLSNLAFRILALTLPVAFTPSARGMSATPDGSDYSLVTSVMWTPTDSRELAAGRVRPTGGDGKDFGVDGLDCITADDSDEEPLQAADDSSGLPDNPEQTLSLWIDRARVPSRDDQGSDAILLSDLRFPLSQIGSAALANFSVTHCPSWIDPHIQERAPPRPS